MRLVDEGAWPITLNAKISGLKFFFDVTNTKVPMIVDGATTVLDSSAILLYLAEMSGQFLSAPEDRGPMLSWLIFTASGIGPFTGQCVHFRHYAPEPVHYAIKRYDFEAWRHWKT